MLKHNDYAFSLFLASHILRECAVFVHDKIKGKHSVYQNQNEQVLQEELHMCLNLIIMKLWE